MILRPLYSRGKRELVSYNHPVDEGLSACPVSGRSIGVELLPFWKETPVAAIYVLYINGFPVFNSLGMGEEVTTELLNNIM